ncbi:alpha/beta fold hydrolase [Paracoccus aminophilus]|uniref:Alpha/beta hydrolase n=1 Tax=Paracoccus aminophilus JCM 7686 TaxID=1367847 RepID=S5Z0F8_PARAH|nr:alpha/beta hydrolase [Paracoccus aminophilus]AGT10951.1 alpha/beta hydrolase [Paracoccus aminophilus JCM 7686]
MNARNLIAVTLLMSGTLIWQPVPAQPSVTTDTSESAAAVKPASNIVTMDRISVEVLGDHGPDVILLPGLATPRDVWKGLADNLAGKARLHLVQITGFDGQESPVNAAGGLLQGVADEVAAYAKENKLDHPAVIGHSLGGTVALLSALDHPEAYSKVMVVDTLPFLTLLFDANATAASAEPMAERMKTMMAAAPQGKVDPATLRGMSLTQAGLDQVETWVAASRNEVSAEAMKEMLTLDLRPRLSSLSIPMVLVYPESARATALYTDLYKPVRDHKLDGIEGTGHFVMLDQPANFETAVKRFLDLQ